MYTTVTIPAAYTNRSATARAASVGHIVTASGTIRRSGNTIPASFLGRRRDDWTLALAPPSIRMAPAA